MVIVFTNIVKKIQERNVNLVHISAVRRQKNTRVDASELIDNGEPTKVTLVLVQDFRRNVFY